MLLVLLFLTLLTADGASFALSSEAHVAAAGNAVVCMDNYFSSLLQRASEFQEVGIAVNESQPSSPSVSGQVPASVRPLAHGDKLSRQVKRFQQSPTRPSTSLYQSPNATQAGKFSQIQTISTAFRLHWPGSLLLVFIAGAIITCLRRRMGAQKPPPAGEEKAQKAPGRTSRAGFQLEDSLLTKDPEGKVYTYNNDNLLEWRSVAQYTGSVFCDWRVLRTVLQVVLLAIAVAMLQVFLVPHSHQFQTDRFQDFFKFVRVFIAFMLGLFLNSSFQRWWSTVTSFKKFLVSIKQLVYTLHTIGVRVEQTKKVERLCIAACYILDEDMHAAAMNITRVGSDRWTKKLNWMEEKGFLQRSEKQELELRQLELGQLGLHSQVIWSWIGEVITQVKQEPQLTPPMYVKLIVLCHTCIACIEDLQTNLMVQVPFSYSHMLATLVHVVNIFFAVATGLTIGCEVAEAREKGWSGDFENIEASAMQLFTLVAQPMLYQAVLVIAEANVQPYGDEIRHMPTDTYIRQMLDELEIMHAGFGKARERAQAETDRKAAEDEGALSPQIKKKQKDDEDDEEHCEDDDCCDDI